MESKGFDNSSLRNRPLKDELQVLISRSLFLTTSAADMRSFGFKRVSHSDPEETDNAEYFLHVQCPWRIECQDNVVTGRSDFFEHRDLGTPDDSWELDQGKSLQELRLRELFKDPEPLERRSPVENLTGKFVVMAVETSIFGDLAIRFDTGCVLRVFPARSRGESWRFFRRGDISSHLVWIEEEGSRDASG